MKISDERLAAVEKQFHKLLLDIARDFESAVPSELPTLTDREGEAKRIPHVSISGMFGGCGYRFVEIDGECCLRVVASSRMDENFRRVWHVDESGYSRDE